MVLEDELIRSGCLRDKSCRYDQLKQNYMALKQRTRERNAHHPTNPDRVRNQRIHRQKVKNCDIRVEADEPFVVANLKRGQEMHNRQLAAYAKLELENSAIMMRIKNLELEPRKAIDPPRNILQPDRHRQRKLFQQTFDNCIMYQRLQKVKGEIRREAHSQWFKKQASLFLLRAKYPPYWMTLCSPFERHAYRKAEQNPRPIVFLDFEVRNRILGRVVFELFADICPLTAENFRALCVGRQGKTYRNHQLERILPGLFWRGAGKSPYGRTMPLENYSFLLDGLGRHILKHNEPGILSMVGINGRTHSTEFMISAKALPSMNNENVAFGRVIQGMDFLDQLSIACDPWETGKPRFPAFITNCGETSLADLPYLDEPRSIRELKSEEKFAQELTRHFYNLDGCKTKFPIGQGQDPNLSSLTV